MSSRYSSAELSNFSSSNSSPPREPKEHDEDRDRADPFDINVLIAKLEQYKARLDETDAQLQRQKSITPKDAAAVAAAARFRQEIERRGGANATPPLSAVKRMFDWSDTSSKNATSPTLDEGIWGSLQDRSGNAEVRSKEEINKPAVFPTRSTSIARRPSSLAQRRNLAQPPAPLRSQTTHSVPKRPPGAVRSGSVKAHQRSITVGDPRYSISSAIVSSAINPLKSGQAGPQVQVARAKTAPHSPVLMRTPMEDQIRRELEALAVKEGGADLLEQTKRTSGWSTPVVHVIELDTEAFPAGQEKVQRPQTRQEPEQAIAPLQRAATATDAEDFIWRPHDTGMSRFGRKFSIFRSFRKKTTADELIEMYMSDEQLKEIRAPKPKGKKFMGFR